MKRKTAANSTFAIGGGFFLRSQFVVTESSVLRMNICGENRHLRQARKRWWQYKHTEYRNFKNLNTNE